MTARERYARVLAAPGVARLLAAAVLARMPIGIDGLAIVLFVQAQTGSFARAGAVTGAFGVAVAVSTPLQGRLVDRHGHARVLLPLAAGHALALGGLVALGLAGAPLGALVATGAAAGATLPPIGAVIRPLLPGLLAGEPGLVATAYALDSVLIELVFVTGPLLTAVMVSAASPAGSLLAACALVLAGTAALLATPASRGWRPARARDSHVLGPLLSPAVRTLVLVTLPVAACLGMVEVALPAFATGEGHRGAAGLLLALWSVGSGAAGLAYGGRHHAGTPAGLYVRLAALLPLTIAPLLLASSIPVMIPLALVSGMGIAPLFTAGNQILAAVAPPGSETEAFTWPVTALGLGIAGGNALAGILVEASGWRLAVATGAAIGAAGGVMAAARRDRLVAGAAPAGPPPVESAPSEAR